MAVCYNTAKISNKDKYKSMYLSDNFITASGVILSRKPSGENNLWVTLFLKGIGILGAGAPGFSSRRSFGGDNEPFVWAVFKLKKKQKSRGYFIDDIEVTDDMLEVRDSRDTLMTAMTWCKSLMKYLISGQPDDELLAALYWNMKLLCMPGVPSDASDWRFVWRWLEVWGLAPEITGFYSSMNFNNDEISLLAKLSVLNTQGTIKLFSSPLSPNIRENVFKVASRLARNFLNEK